MANLFIRTYTFVDGTTAYGSQVEAEIGNIVTVLNNLNIAATTWGQVSIAHATSVPLIADCSAGTQHIADFKNNAVIKASIESTGKLNCVGIAVGSAKITGGLAATAATDIPIFSQIIYGVAPVQTVATTAFTTTSSTFQTSNLSASITPSSSSKRVKITVTGSISIAASTGQNAQVSLFRGASNLATGADADFSRVFSAAAQTIISPMHVTFIDSPATTSSTTYAIKIKNSDNATTVGFGTNEDQVMILEEIV